MKNKRLLLIVGMFGMQCGLGAYAGNLREATNTMYQEHFKKTLFGGYFAASGLWKMTKGQFGYPCRSEWKHSYNENIYINDQQVQSTKTTTIFSEANGKIFKNIRRGSIGALFGSGLLTYSLLKSWTSKNEQALII